MPRTRYVVSCFAMGLMMSLISGCQSAATPVRTSSNEAGTLFTLENAQARVVVDAPRGRIMHYGLVDGSGAFRDVFWSNPEADQPRYDVGRWTNWGGDKIWPWPQDAWRWPPPEPKAGYQVEAQADKLVMRSEMPRQNVRVTREVELDGATSSMVVTSRFDQLEPQFGDAVGVWSITQVPHPRQMYVRIPNIGDRNRYLARAKAEDDRFRTRLVGQAVVQLEPDWKLGGKTFMDGDVIAAVYDDVVLLQRLVPVHSYGIWAPDERCQIYVHSVDAPNVPPGYSYVELEWAAPTVPTMHVEKAPLRIIYKIIRLSANTTQQDIIRMVDQLP